MKRILDFNKLGVYRKCSKREISTEEFIKICSVLRFQNLERFRFRTTNLTWTKKKKKWKRNSCLILVWRQFVRLQGKTRSQSLLIYYWKAMKDWGEMMTLWLRGMLGRTSLDAMRSLQILTTIGLLHEDAICLKFTTKPRLHEMFLELLSPCCFTRLFFVSRCLGSSFFLKFTSSHIESEVWWWNWLLVVFTRLSRHRKLKSKPLNSWSQEFEIV